MQRDKAIPGQVLRKMSEAFFELSADGVLSYRDPMIGPLANREKQLAVVMNPSQAHLELRVCGVAEQVFALSDGIAQACRAAFHAYFVTFQALCTEGRTARAA